MPSQSETAEQRFRQAFERLKDNRPEVLPRGTSVTQNNVAREAGTDPTALRKARYPALVREIQAWVEVHSHLEEKKAERQRRCGERESLEDQLVRVKKERDDAQSKLASAHHAVLQLLQGKAQLQARINDVCPPPTLLR
jgi:hypothetical protein